MWLCKKNKILNCMSKEQEKVEQEDVEQEEEGRAGG